MLVLICGRPATRAYNLLFGIKFEVGAAGEGGNRQLRSGADAYSFLGSDTHNSILNCIADQSNDP